MKKKANEREMKRNEKNEKMRNCVFAQKQKRNELKD